MVPPRLKKEKKVPIVDDDVEAAPIKGDLFLWGGRRAEGGWGGRRRNYVQSSIESAADLPFA